MFATLFVASLALVHLSHCNPVELEERCQPGETFFGGSCYFFVSEPLTWTEAAQFCRDRGSYLVSINNVAELNFIVGEVEDRPNDFMVGIGRENLEFSELAGSLTASVWIGANDRANEGNFFWVDTQQPVTYNNYNQGEPNNLNGKEHCIEIYLTSDGTNGKWNDIMCIYRQPFVCEDPL